MSWCFHGRKLNYEVCISGILSSGPGIGGLDILKEDLFGNGRSDLPSCWL